MGKTYRRDSDDAFYKFKKSDSNKWKKDHKKYPEKKPKIKNPKIEEDDNENPVKPSN